MAEAIACVQDGRPALVEVITKRVPTSLHRFWERQAGCKEMERYA
jgi:hypothetical protein